MYRHILYFIYLNISSYMNTVYVDRSSFLVKLVVPLM